MFLTVLHRLVAPGSDRAAERWKQNYLIAGAESLELQHLYRAMAWLGEPLPEAEQKGATPFVARTTKDLVEEELFRHRRDLFSSLDLVFFDTTSIYFEGEGGQTIGWYGHSKDHRPDRLQMVVGMVLDNQGNPVCSELWPGNAPDVKSLVPMVDRLKTRFPVGEVCIVADRGMISAETMSDLQRRNWKYILGVRMRSSNAARQVVARAGRDGRYQEVFPESDDPDDPAPLKVKRFGLHDSAISYVATRRKHAEIGRSAKPSWHRCGTPCKAETSRWWATRAIVGFCRPVGNASPSTSRKSSKKRAMTASGLLTTNAELTAPEVAVKYKQLWVVEDIFRSMKSLLETRPIFHKRDETIRGHVFCTYLALVLRKELQDRLERKGWTPEWADVIRDLDQLQEVEIHLEGKAYLLRTEAKGTTGKVFQACGVALPPTLRQR